MAWIKRNLFFVIGSVVALALMGLAGWFAYSKWTLNNEKLAQVNSLYDELKGLKTRNPHPGDAKVDNIKIAKDQQAELSNYVAKARAYFVPISRIPSPEEAAKITDYDFTTALSRTIDQMQKEAANSSVTVASNYNFSFEAERQRVQFDAKGLLPLATQLGEVKAICDVLFQAKVNSLENIRRERVAEEDSQGGLQTDYLTEKRTTNDLAVLTPYEVVFKCFSTELAGALSGFSSSPHCMIVKTINVEGAPITQPEAQPFAGRYGAVAPTYYPQPVTPQYGSRSATEGSGDADARMRARYGLSPGGRGASRYGAGAANQGGIAYRGLQTPQPQYQYPQYGQATVQPAVAHPGGPPTVLDERQLKVTVNLILVKLLPTK